ncbi:NADPH-dependent F420 reductase [Corallococcus aberystwythensis]|uniref:NADP oxidoreductase n=1 Tax=Corallococcus aberystwythensis TaxID=2316722 RepID=A0A3A8QEG9_9BACT|nr:NADP oxidoreductase [Corallococcus aberystwythensis]
MKLGILGAGRVGGTLARALAGKGHEVIVGTPDPAKRAAAWQGPPVSHTTLEAAASAASFVIHATPGDTALETLTALREPLRGKVLLDVANATVRLPNGLPGGLCPPDSSLGEKLQEALPETRVVKSLNTMLFTVMTAPGALATPPTAFLGGNDPAAKEQVAVLLGELGWRPEWILDLGGIETARATEALILLVPHVIRRQGLAPFAVSVVR